MRVSVSIRRLIAVLEAPPPSWPVDLYDQDNPPEYELEQRRLGETGLVFK